MIRRFYGLLTAAFREQLVRSATAVLSVRVASIGLEFITGLVLTRLLLASGYGVYAYVLSWVTVLAIPATAGFDRLTLRESGALSARRDWPHLTGLLWRGSQVVLTAGFVIAGLSFALADRWAGITSHGLLQAFRTGLLAIPFIAWSKIRIAGLQGLGQPVQAGLPEGVAQPILLVVLVAASLAAGASLSGTWAVSVYLASTVFTCAIATILFRRALPAEARHAPPAFRTRAWLRQAIPFMFMLGMNVLLTHTDVIMLGWIDSARSSGVYRIAWQVSALTALPLAAMNASFAARIAAAHSMGNIPQLQGPARRAARLTLLISLPIAIVIWLAGSQILGIFGVQFVAGYPSLTILTLGQLANSAAGSVGYLLIMTEYEREAATGLAIAAILNVLLNLWWIPLLGMIGAALASCVTLIGLNLAFAVLVYRKLGLRTVFF